MEDYQEPPPLSLSQRLRVLLNGPTLAFTASALFAFSLAFFVIPILPGEGIFLLLGYPAVAVSALGAVFYAGRVGWDLWKEEMPSRHWRNWRNRLPDLFIISAFTGWILSAEPAAFRIILDELYLNAASFMLHLDRLPAIPQAFNNYEGFNQLTDAFVDKRPIFFPFLLSLVHDLVGFRPENAFYLNGVLTFILNLLLYFTWGRGSRYSGTLALGLVATLPIWISNANSGHFEILNLLMLLGCWISAKVYFQSPTSDRLMLLFFMLCLLAQTRYENALYLVAFASIVLWFSLVKGKWPLPWASVIVPFLFVPYVLQFRIGIVVQDFYWQTGPEAGREDTFSLAYISENLREMMRYLLSMSEGKTNSLLLSLMAMAAVPAWLLSRRDNKLALADPGAEQWANRAFIGGLLLGLGLLLVFNFGLFTQYVTARLSLPLHLGMIGFVLSVVKHSPRRLLLYTMLLFSVQGGLFFLTASPEAFARLAWYFPFLIGTLLVVWFFHLPPDKLRRFILGGILIWAVFITRPVTSHQVYYQDYSPRAWLYAQKNFLDQLDRKDVLIISRDAILPVLEEFPSASLTRLWKNPENLRLHLEAQNYHDIYVLQIFYREAEEEAFKVDATTSIPANVEVEKVWQQSLLPNVLARASRVVAVHDRGVPPQGKAENEN